VAVCQSVLRWASHNQQGCTQCKVLNFAVVKIVAYLIEFFIFVVVYFV